MNVEPGTLTVKQIVDDFDKKEITVNPEYQRGEVWHPDQQKKLIDSLFRGYQLPIFYLHEIERTNSRGQIWTTLEIIDGQQRCNALNRFINGDLQLFNMDDEQSKFSPFLRDTSVYPCPWGGQRFSTLSPDLQEELLNKPLPIAFITEASQHEVRDLFIRLQSGSSLNNQEKRDAYPGEFTDFILKLGGKPALGYDGYDFFTKILKMKPRTDRGKTRQLAAQIAILYLERCKNGVDHISDATRTTIDDYYDTQLDFDAQSDESQRLLHIIDKLNVLLTNWKGPRLLAHNAIHLVLFLDSILDDYTPLWEEHFLDALGKFSKLYIDGREANKNSQFHEAWQEYGQWARTNSDAAESISRRHRYFSSRMVESLGTRLVPKDHRRAFNDHERQFIYWRDSGECQVCLAKVDWSIAEIHHVIEHQHGGRTVIDNGVLVHDFCHPKGKDADEFLKSYIHTKTSEQRSAMGYNP